VCFGRGLRRYTSGTVISGRLDQQDEILAQDHGSGGDVGSPFQRTRELLLVLGYAFPQSGTMSDVNSFAKEQEILKLEKENR
jgi:hypothetical protein